MKSDSMRPLTRRAQGGLAGRLYGPAQTACWSAGRFGFRTPAAALPFLAVLIGFAPVSASACAACYGQSDSPMAQGMNWGILSLLGFITMVLVGVAGFFLYLARRSAQSNSEDPLSPPQPMPDGLKAAGAVSWTFGARPSTGSSLGDTIKA